MRSSVKYKTPNIDYYKIVLDEITLPAIQEALQTAHEVGIGENAPDYLFVEPEDYTETIEPLVQSEWFQNVPTPSSPLKFLSERGVTIFVLPLPGLDRNEIWFVSFPRHTEKERRQKACHSAPTTTSILSSATATL